MGASRQSLAVHMNGDVKLVGLRLELLFAMRADEGLGHQNKIARDKNYRHGNRNIVPRHVKGVAKPVYLAGGQAQRHGY